MARDDRPWLERMLGPDPAENALRRAVTLLAVAIVHLGRGTDADTLAREVERLDRRT